MIFNKNDKSLQFYKKNNAFEHFRVILKHLMIMFFK